MAYTSSARSGGYIPVRLTFHDGAVTQLWVDPMAPIGKLKEEIEARQLVTIVRLQFA